MKSPFNKLEFSIPVSSEPYCLGFKYGTSTFDIMTATPDIPFRPIGLMLFGTKKETTLIHATIGNIVWIKASGEPVPGYFFESGYDFEDFKRLFDEPVNEYERIFQRWLKKYPDVAKRLLFDGAPSLQPGMPIKLHIQGPCEHAIVWGHGLIYR